MTQRWTKETRSHNRGGFVYITGGEFRGRKLATPGGATHPMGERERLALFNMLEGKIDRDTDILDAYAGGGTLGFEAISRGARRVLFCDKSSQACQTIAKNAQNLGVPLDPAPLRMSVSEMAAGITERFDLILMDPPYDLFQPRMISELVSALKRGGLLVASHPGESTEIDDLNILKSRSYAGAHLTIYQRNESGIDGKINEADL